MKCVNVYSQALITQQTFVRLWRDWDRTLWDLSTSRVSQMSPGLQQNCYGALFLCPSKELCAHETCSRWQDFGREKQEMVALFLAAKFGCQVNRTANSGFVEMLHP